MINIVYLGFPSLQSLDVYHVSAWLWLSFLCPLIWMLLFRVVNHLCCISISHLCIVQKKCACKYVYNYQVNGDENVWLNGDENVALQADNFQRQGRTIQRKMWLENMKVKLVVLGIVIVIILIIWLAICKGFKCKHWALLCMLGDQMKKIIHELP